MTKAIPPVIIWPDTGKTKPGPTPLQKKYFINLMPPEKRPHWHTNDSILSVGGYGSSKCFQLGTKMLMFDGTIKSVEDIAVNDLLMGPDSKPRKVIELARGKDKFYKVTPIKGEPFYCNENHILTLKAALFKPEQRKRADGSIYTKPNVRYKEPIINVSIKDYLTWSKRKKANYKLYRAETIYFPSSDKELLIPPYILGTWLGDGHKNTMSLTNIDEAVIDSWRQYANSLGETFDIHQSSCIDEQGKPKLPFYKILNQCTKLRHYNLSYNKHIPFEYKTASEESRLELLAGLLDTDGGYNKCSFYIVQKLEVLANDIAFLARSLGFAAYVKKVKSHCYYKGEKKEGDYYGVSISGNLERIPTRIKRKQATPRRQVKNVLVTGFTLEEQPIDDYYGFELEDDHLFLLADFTVVHNTYGALALDVFTCLENPGTKAFIGALDITTLKKIILGDITKMFTIDKAWDHPAVISRLGDKQDNLRFANGSVISLVNLTQFIKITGVNAGLFHAEEPHLFPNGEETYNTILSRLRATPPEIRQLVMCTNPEKTKGGWMNHVFELHRFDKVDTSDGPVELPVGKPCTCQYCTFCFYQKKEKIAWEKNGDDYFCPSCEKKKDYWTWEGKKYHCPGDQQYTRVIKSESFHNKNLSADYFQGMANQYDEQYFDIMVKGKTNVNLRDNYVFSKYAKENNLLEDRVEINWLEPLYWGLDFNFRPQSSVVCQIKDKELIAKDEIVIFGPPEDPTGGANARDVGKEFVRRYKKFNKGAPVYIYGDPNGFNGQTKRELTRYEQIIDELKEGGFKVELRADKKHVPFSERIDNTNEVLEKKILKINPDLKWLIKSFEELDWKEDSKSYGPNDVNKLGDKNARRTMNLNRIYCITDITDAIGYLIYREFPVLKEYGVQRSARFLSGVTITENADGSVTKSMEKAETKEIVTIADAYEEHAIKTQNEIHKLNNQSLNGLLKGVLPKFRL